jgi:hypothetical protein
MLALDTTELARVFRSEVDDPLKADCGDEDCLWKDSDVYYYMTEAFDAVMRGVGGVAGQVSVPYAIGQSTITLPKKVFEISSAWLASGKALRITNLSDAGYNRQFPERELDLGKVDIPDSFMTENGYNRGVLYPAPSEAGTLNIMGRFTLAFPLEAGMPVPLRDIPDQRLVLTYMKYLAYAKHDAETYDLGRSSRYQSEFDVKIMDREVELRRNRRRPGTVRMDY